ncbi:hypothetical protein PRZ48_008366 [Zasmidium cellare]|uniref:Uncharacterized protein n=1 Tax=Zasmidium cellare TaxID=395010 RepID=A0ABR0EFA8_ZASCE|nr:hypothetical protein PRZ48_008366 [Zasmidium cellare]
MLDTYAPPVRSPLLPNQATSLAMEPHWLMESSGRYLDQTNTDENLKGVNGVPFDSLALRVFIIYKDNVLLCREDGAWTVPKLYFPGSDFNTKTLCQRIIDALETIRLPSSLTHELQIMEFSMPNPMPMQSNVPKQKTLFTVLSSSYPALDQGIASWDEQKPPNTATFRWIKKDRGGTIPLSPKTAQSGGLTPQTIALAHKRSTHVNRTMLLDRLSRTDVRELVWRNISAKLITRMVLDGRPNLGLGLVAVSQNTPKRFVALIRQNSEEEFENMRVGGKTYWGHWEMVVAGKWDKEKIEGMETFAAWSQVFDQSGRVRMGVGADWD